MRSFSRTRAAVALPAAALLAVYALMEMRSDGSHMRTILRSRLSSRGASHWGPRSD
jgi:hypothetical protein